MEDTKALRNTHSSIPRQDSTLPAAPSRTDTQHRSIPLEKTSNRSKPRPWSYPNRQMQEAFSSRQPPAIHDSRSIQPHAKIPTAKNLRVHHATAQPAA